MRVRPEEITSILKEQIADYQALSSVDEVGRVVYVGDGIARIYGLDKVMYGEMVEFEGGAMGMALNLEEDNVGCALFGSDAQVAEGSVVKRTGRVVEVPVGEELVGRVVNPLGVPLDGKGPINATRRNPVERLATGVVSRQPVKEPLQTGI